MPARTNDDTHSIGGTQAHSAARPLTSSDGRLARGIRARESIAEALIALLEDGVAQPTARQVAERAGVSLRLVFHHFDDMEQVLKTAVAIQIQRHWRDIEPVGTDGGLKDRVAQTIQMRTELFATIAPVRRAAARRAEASPVLTEQLEVSRRTLRSHLRETFQNELASGDEGELLDALEVSTSFETWDFLRQTKRSADDTKKTMVMLALAVLGSPGNSAIAGEAE